MKLILVLFAVVAAISAIPTANRDLQSDLEYIVSTIPLSEIRAIARRYAETDAEFQDVVRYLQGPEWASLVDAVAQHETWQKFKAFMANAGVDIDGVIQYLHDLIAGVILPKNTNQRSVRDFVDEVLAIVDLQAIIAALNDKLNNSPDFQEFFGKISSHEAYLMVEDIRAMDEVQRIAGRLREMGIDVDKVVDLVYGLLGWNKIQIYMEMEMLQVIKYMQQSKSQKACICLFGHCWGHCPEESQEDKRVQQGESPKACICMFGGCWGSCPEMSQEDKRVRLGESPKACICLFGSCWGTCPEESQEDKRVQQGESPKACICIFGSCWGTCPEESQ
ncbi:protein G12-like [Onthophagus taurus]|uniref:protein G12-like n=1 Tax=Onthophagus taurus TaxID=166361 RepID=UPI0039BE2634